MAAAAAAGAGAGIYLTTRGAESLVESSVDEVAARAQAVMKEEGIVADASSSEEGGDKREFKGKKGDLDVTIEMERESDSTTRVEVSGTQEPGRVGQGVRPAAAVADRREGLNTVSF